MSVSFISKEVLALGNGLPPDQAEEKIVDIYGPQGLRKYIAVNLELARSPLAYKYNVHELMPEQDQYPPDWKEWPVNHVCDSEKPLENFVESISMSQFKDGSRFWKIQEDAQYTIKGHLISKALLGVFKSTKKPTDFV